MQQTPEPEHVVVTPVGQTTVTRSNNKKLVWGLICLAGPTVLFFVALFGSVIMNQVLSDESSMRTIVNIFTFLSGAIVVLTWLPGIIIGIILLASRKKVS